MIPNLSPDASSNAITLNEESIRRFRNTLTTLRRLVQSPVSDVQQVDHHSPVSELDVQRDDQGNITAAYATLITRESVDVIPLIQNSSTFSAEDAASFIGDEATVSLIYTYYNNINQYLNAERRSPRLRNVLQDLTAYADSPSDEDANVALNSSSQIRNILDRLNQVVYVPGGEVRCPICLETPLPTETVVQLTCHETHKFHRDCLQGWLQAGSRSCPICREPIEVADPPASMN